MKVGDLVKRVHGAWSNGGRIGLVIEQLPKDLTRGITTGDWLSVQWNNGQRETVRWMFLEVVNESR